MLLTLSDTQNNPERVDYEFNSSEHHRTHLNTVFISKKDFPPTNPPTKVTTFLYSLT
tara:strand:+ start:752 stop:922 length:171 start_codon:yes stop_codon:yes gene_type:complete